MSATPALVEEWIDLDFPGSQAAMVYGEVGEVSTSVFEKHVRFRPLSEPGDCIWNTVPTKNVVPVGPVARAIVRGAL